MSTMESDASIVRRKFAGSSALAQHGLVHAAELGHGEGLAEERVRDARVLELRAQSPEGVVDDRAVVEGELGQFVLVEPADVLVGDGALDLVGVHERPVDDRHDPLVGRAVDVAEGVELLEVLGSEPRRLVAGCGRRRRRAPRRRGASRRAAPTSRGRARGAGARAAAADSARRVPVVGAEREDHGRDGEPRCVARSRWDIRHLRRLGVRLTRSGGIQLTVIVT